MTVTGFMPRQHLQQLLNLLGASGYRCKGPQVRDGAIVMDDLASVDQLPQGVRDRQQPGEYWLEQQNDERLFAWANGPQALKPLLFKPREVLWYAEAAPDGTLRFREQTERAEPIALVGARACDLAALALLDAHFLRPPYPDPLYARRRDNLLVVAVDCGHPAATCFCASTGDGPLATGNFDIALNEIDEGFLVRSGSDKGRKLLTRMTLAPVSPHQKAQADDQFRAAVASQHRRLPGSDLRNPLMANLDHARWQAVADRCLACGNCTSVCPTCFCASNYQVPQLDGHSSEQVREWSSCFTLGHSYMHGHLVRPDTRSRYRQWLIHKLASWHDQYDRSGCVGCGRCISWCPVGIDLTVEAEAICGGGGHHD